MRKSRGVWGFYFRWSFYLLLFTENSGAPEYENQGTKWHVFVLAGIDGIYMGSRMCIFEPDLHTCHFFQIKLGKEVRVAYQNNHA